MTHKFISCVVTKEGVQHYELPRELKIFTTPVVKHSVARSAQFHIRIFVIFTNYGIADIKPKDYTTYTSIKKELRTYIEC